MEWKDWAIHLILSKSTQLPKDHSRSQEPCLRHTPRVALHKNSALLYHWETALGPYCRGHAQKHPQDPTARVLACIHKPVIALEVCQKHPNITRAFNMKNSLLIYQQLPTVQLLALMKHVCYTG